MREFVLSGGRIPCTPWQLTHCAAFESFFSRRSCPCLLVRYLSSWSTGSDGLYPRMNSLEEWQRAQNSGIHERSFLRFSLSGQRFAISADISASVGLPPWQPEHISPPRKWTSLTISLRSRCAFGSPFSRALKRISSGKSGFEWQRTQLSPRISSTLRSSMSSARSVARGAEEESVPAFAATKNSSCAWLGSARNRARAFSSTTGAFFSVARNNFRKSAGQVSSETCPGAEAVAGAAAAPFS